MDFEQRILQFTRKNKLMVSRDSVLVGVSGGADSMALLLTLAGLRHCLGIDIHAAHFNHRFRLESKDDEAFVAKWCKRLNVPLVIGQRKGGKIKHLSEDQARQMRFEFFIKTARQLGCQSVALAHTRNDLAETVLMRLMRGSGLYGLRAILPKRDIDGVSFVRPLLGVNRQEIEAYLKVRKVPFCTDNTNNQKIYERNKVRRELLPLLARDYNPQIINALSDLATTAGEDYDFISLQVDKQFKKISIISARKARISLNYISKQHPAIRRLLLRKMVELLIKAPVALSFEHIHAMECLIELGQAKIDLPHYLKAVKTKEYLEIFYDKVS